MRRSWQRALRVGRADVTSDVDNELEFHLETQVEELVADGWSPERARLEALRRFGDVHTVQSELIWIGNRREGAMRRTQLFADLGQDVRLATRQLRKRPFFAVVVIAILAIGIGVNAAVFGVVDALLLRPLPFAASEQLVMLTDERDRGTGDNVSLPEFEDWQRSADFVSALTTIALRSYTLTDEGAPDLLLGGVLRGDPVRTFGMRALRGRVFSDDEVRTDADVVVLSESFWQERFGGSDVIGRALRLNDVSYTVIGVVSDELGVLRPANPPSFWLLMKRHEQMTRGLHFLQVVGRLQNGLTLEQARPRAETVSARLRASSRTTHGIAVASLRETLVGDTRDLMLILMGSVLIVLLIVCANLANLFMSQSLDRSREFSVRVALGAGRFRLVRQVITESVALGVLGGVAGLVLSRVLTRSIAAVSSAAGLLAPSSLGDARVIAFTFAIALLVALTFGLWPALRAARADVQSTLRSAGDSRSLGGRGAWRRRRALIAAELALSVVLLAGAGLLVRSTRNLLHVPLGFEPADVITAGIAVSSQRYETNEQRALFYQQLVDRLGAIPGVEFAGATSHLPLRGEDTSGQIEIVGRTFPDGEQPNVKKREASPDFFAAFGIPLVQGRVFTELDRAGSVDVVVISQILADRYWPGQNPVGQRIRHLWGPGDEHEIVGVVGDIRHDGLHLPVIGTVYRPVYQFAQHSMNFVLRTERDPEAVIAAARLELAQLDPRLPLIGIDNAQRLVSASVGPRRTTMLLLSGFACIAVILGAVGIYAVTAQAVTQRRREIGVRMAIGARRSDVLRMVIREEFGVIAVGLGAGLLGAWGATRILKASLFQVSPTDPVSFGAAAALLVLIGLLAAWVPARRAARTDPATALRAE